MDEWGLHCRSIVARELQRRGWTLVSPEELLPRVVGPTQGAIGECHDRIVQVGAKAARRASQRGATVLDRLFALSRAQTGQRLAIVNRRFLGPVGSNLVGRFQYNPGLFAADWQKGPNADKFLGKAKHSMTTDAFSHLIAELLVSGRIVHVHLQKRVPQPALRRIGPLKIEGTRHVDRGQVPESEAHVKQFAARGPGLHMVGSQLDGAGESGVGLVPLPVIEECMAPLKESVGQLQPL